MIQIHTKQQKANQPSRKYIQKELNNKTKINFQLNSDMNTKTEDENIFQYLNNEKTVGINLKHK